MKESLKRLTTIAESVARTELWLRHLSFAVGCGRRSVSSENKTRRAQQRPQCIAHCNVVRSARDWLHAPGRWPQPGPSVAIHLANAPRAEA